MAMAAKSRKKTKAPAADNILDDFEDPAKFECDLCNVEFKDRKTYENHMTGKRHSKKLSEVKLKAKNKIIDKEGESEDSDDESEFYCETCDKNFTGYVSYVAHKKGAGHARNVKKEKLKKQLDHMPEVVKNEKEENDSDDDHLPKAYAKCSVCQKEFQGPESFQMHVKSATHLKKVKQAKTLEAMKQDKGENSDDEEIYAKCETCNKNFTGVIPYQIHMQSKLHNKNLAKKKIAEEIKEFCDKTDEGYKCKECEKLFTDPLALKCHLENNSHEKQRAKHALEEFLNSYPEIVYVTPYDKDENNASTDENSSDECDSLYYLICKICNVSFSGPESAQAHVKSKKHINTKRDKKLLKQEKEKKQKNSSETSDENVNGNETPEKVSTNGNPASSSKNILKKSDDEFEVI